MIMIHLYLMTQPKMIPSCVPLHFRVFFFFKFCLLLVSDLDIEVFPYITTNFSVYLLLDLLSLPLSLLLISTTPAYILDKTLVLKTFQTLHNAFLNLVNNAGRIKVQKKINTYNYFNKTATKYIK